MCVQDNCGIRIVFADVIHYFFRPNRLRSITHIHFYVMMNRYKRYVYRLVDRIAFRCDLQRRVDKTNGRCERYLRDTLSKEELSQIKRVWGKWGGRYEVFGFYKHFCGSFNPYYVPNDYYDYAEHVLNLRWSAYFLQHKCNLKFFIPDQHRVNVILQKIDNHYMLKDNTEISEAEAKKILLSTPSFMAKIARGTGGGKGVRKIEWDTIEEKESFVDELVKPIDMEFEGVLKQSEFMARFNPDSVNTIRIITLNINGRCTVLSSFLRMGVRGSFVDNLNGNGILIGMKQDGALHDFGINKRFEKQLESPSGIPFKGEVVPEFERIKQIVVSFHKRIPYANLIGWDVALDENNNVIVIEVNLDSAEIEAHQVFNGPVFGNRLNEVMAYIHMKEPFLRHQMMLY